jgi:hypothetical protein
MAMVGDNNNARVDPEVISPLSKLKGIMRQDDGGFVASTVLSGNDILVVVERAQQKRTRGRGF